VIIITFDIEDWFHMLGVSQTETEREWSRYKTRIHDGTARLLDLLSMKKKKATFFCLGWIAKKYPEVIRSIDDVGHEIGTHSMMHQLVHRQDINAFRRDLSESIMILEDIVGKPVRAYRAPGFSVSKYTPWVFDVLNEMRIEIDCSVLPMSNGYGGFPALDVSGPFVLVRENYSLKMLPISYIKIGPMRMVVSGGGYFRLMPWQIISYCVKKKEYTMTYFHPRDFDPYQPRIPGLTMARRFKSYVGIKTSFKKLSRLLDHVECCDISTAIKKTKWRNVPHINL